MYTSHVPNTYGNTLDSLVGRELSAAYLLISPDQVEILYLHPTGPEIGQSQTCKTSTIWLFIAMENHHFQYVNHL